MFRRQPVEQAWHHPAEACSAVVSGVAASSAIVSAASSGIWSKTQPNQ